MSNSIDQHQPNPRTCLCRHSRTTMSWSDLPADIAAAVANRLTEVADLARFRSVCPSWRSASSSHAARRRVPLLLLPDRSAWSPADDSLREIPLPAAGCRSFLFASNHGWTLAVSSGDLSAALVHPFTGASSDLPPLPATCRGAFQATPPQLVWDWSPRGVLVSPRGGSFFCRPGNGSSWRPVDCSSSTSTISISSVTYCDDAGAFYLLDGRTCKATVMDAETLAVVEVIEPPTLGKEIRRPWSDFEIGLAVSPAELLLIVKWLEWADHMSFTEAFRADRVPGRSTRWSPVADIGERAVFMDHQRAFYVEANGLNRVRRNCLYHARSYEKINFDEEGWDDSGGRYTVSMRNLANPRAVDLGRGSLRKVKCSFFWQHPSWLLPPC
ncbi:unnamed protein product [Urochloa decumbens]|uniref:KIB1-4 beta-propeller domain-containing protein n=1 Tax=Urochloa decumbens TaxID=240449 RepID=A0ABC8W1S2_9POAL